MQTRSETLTETLMNSLAETAELLHYRLGVFVITTIYHAGSQLGVEAIKIILGNAPEKFPHGWQSLNPVEELFEGGISAGLGGVAGLGLCRLYGKLSGHKTSNLVEGAGILIGSMVGYTAMQELGAILHQAWNVPDVKWGPFH